jgi:flavorubredoxin
MAFGMMGAFFGTSWKDRQVVVKEGDVLSTGKHELTFVAAPMVHWPEVIVTYDKASGILFSADAFGKFGANDVEDPEGWDCEARRYYFGIVGKYGAQALALLKKASALDIKTICPLHGPVLGTAEEIAHVVSQYTTWASYAVESEGVLIAYTSVYGHTKAAVEKLAEMLKARGCPKVVTADLARDEMFETVEDAFRYGKIVLATTTYNTDIFPFMRTFISHLVERGYKDRTIGIVENGSWAPSAARVIKGLFAESKGIQFAEPVVTIRSALNAASEAQLSALADALS